MKSDSSWRSVPLHLLLQPILWAFLYWEPEPDCVYLLDLDTETSPLPYYILLLLYLQDNVGKSVHMNAFNAHYFKSKLIRSCSSKKKWVPVLTQIKWTAGFRVANCEHTQFEAVSTLVHFLFHACIPTLFQRKIPLHAAWPTMTTWELNADQPVTGNRPVRGQWWRADEVD